MYLHTDYSNKIDLPVLSLHINAKGKFLEFQLFLRTKTVQQHCIFLSCLNYFHVQRDGQMFRPKLMFVGINA